MREPISLCNRLLCTLRYVYSDWNQFFSEFQITLLLLNFGFL